MELIFTDQKGIGERVGTSLRQHGQTPLFIVAGNSYQYIDAYHVQIRPEHSGDIQQLLRGVKTPCRGILYLCIRQRRKNPVPRRSPNLKRRKRILK